MKRFTETTKWGDGWFSELEPLHKLAWFYLLDNCDGAGVIDKPSRRATFETGVDDWDAFLEAAKGKIEVLDCGKWFIVKFIEVQYKGKVSETSKHHGLVRDSLRKHGLNVRYSIPNDSPSDTQLLPKDYPTNTQGMVPIGDSQVKVTVTNTVQPEGEGPGERETPRTRGEQEDAYGDRFREIASKLSVINEVWSAARISYETQTWAYDNWHRGWADTTDDQLTVVVRFYTEAIEEKLCQSLDSLMKDLPKQIERAHAWRDSQHKTGRNAGQSGSDKGSLAARIREKQQRDKEAAKS